MKEHTKQGQETENTVDLMPLYMALAVVTYFTVWLGVEIAKYCPGIIGLGAIKFGVYGAFFYWASKYGDKQD